MESDLQCTLTLRDKNSRGDAKYFWPFTFNISAFRQRKSLEIGGSFIKESDLDVGVKELVQ